MAQSRASPPQKRRTPGEPTTHSFQKDQIAALDPAVGNGIK
jgi:hypothetical protein